MRVDDDYVAIALAQLESTRGKGPSKADIIAFRLLRIEAWHDPFFTLGERVVLVALTSFMIGYGKMILWLSPGMESER